ncbi:beta-glucuronidase [Lactiplantibacillus garii]|uniref:Beta-glucuronidase n=1 Tax=Lactiplantibacillus garii TaxID=2306423 RepID=A0A426D529_9LACO|nr:beta-glucuronidase [Lactiplantibacillus garii]
MIRLFEQHHVRRVRELDGTWEFQRENDSQTYHLAVPGCWEQHPDLATYRGRGQYHRTIQVERAGTDLQFEFQGVSHTADVYFDGVKIAHHYNAYTPFTARVADATAGSHQLTVAVDNRFSEASALHKPNDYYTYGGIVRGVTVAETPAVFIKQSHFTSTMTAIGWRGELLVTVVNTAATAKPVALNVSLAGQRATLSSATLAPHTSRVLRWCAPFDQVTAWSPAHPQLYLATAELVVAERVIDDLIERVGFRQVKTVGNRIQLNGHPVFLQGFNRHEDSVAFGCALPFQQLVQDLDLMVAMGANAVRTAHYPNDQRFLDLCDERGLLVWEEAHARGLTVKQMQNPNFDRQCAACNREMATAHFNHPSIVIWGLLNECASDTTVGRKKYQAQYQQLRKLDSTRPLTSATCQHFKDRCLDLPDVVSYNLYTGWYEDGSVKAGNARELAWIDQTAGRGKPLIVSEFGAGGIYGYRNPTRCKWSEERQADILGECLDTYLNDPRLSGTFIWQFCDCRVTEEEWFAVRPRSYNNKGVLDEYRRPKLAYDVVKTKFKQHLHQLNQQ